MSFEKTGSWRHDSNGFSVSFKVSAVCLSACRTFRKKGLYRTGKHFCLPWHCVCRPSVLHSEFWRRFHNSSCVSNVTTMFTVEEETWKPWSWHELLQIFVANQRTYNMTVLSVRLNTVLIVSLFLWECVVKHASEGLTRIYCRSICLNFIFNNCRLP